MRHEESEMQKQCISWFRLQFPRYAKLMFAVPNGGSRRLREACIMKAEGVTAGVADVLFLYPNAKHHALCIEFKTKVGRQSPSQKEFQKAVEAVGYRYAVIRSVEEFIALVKAHIYLPDES